VRVIDEAGNQLGVLRREVAIATAKERGYDLILVSPTAVPPVCRIGDSGKFKYELSKKDKEAHKSSKSSVLKELKFTPKTGRHDIDVRIRQATEFLNKGHKIKFAVFFRGREVTHADLGKKILDDVAQALVDLGEVETPAKLEGRNMLMIMAPKKGK
jgi:translation initiation factor IF-3